MLNNRLIAYLVLLLSAISWSQDVSPRFNFVSRMGDVPKVGIYTINQDDYGFMWIGTNGSGLYRYDGLDYKSYRFTLNDSTSLNSSIVYSTYLDDKDRLWVGTGEGLNLYDRNKDRFIRIPNTEFGVDENTNIAIRSLQQGNDGSLYIGTFGQGLYVLDLSSFAIKQVLNSPLNQSIPLTVYSIKVDKKGKIYAATNLGLQEYDKEKNLIKPSVFLNGEYIKVHMESLLIDDDDNIWAGSNYDGIFKLSHFNGDDTGIRTIENFKISNNLFFSLTDLKDGTLLCGTENDGLFHIDAEGNIIHHYLASNKDEKSLLSNSIWSLFTDHDDRVWLGYYNKGIAVYDELHDKFNGLESIYNNSNSLHTSSVSSIAEDEQGRFWIGMDGGGIDLYNKKTKKFTHINKQTKGEYGGLGSEYIQCVFIDSKKNKWAGSWDKGIYFLKNGTKKWINFNTENTRGKLKSNTIVSITEDLKGIIWIATFHNGLHSYDPNTKEFTHHSSQAFIEHGLSNCDAWKVLADSKDNLWLGTTHGLFKIQNKNGKFEIVSMLDRMGEKYDNATTANHILSLYESENGILWIGTKGAGLCKYDIDNDKLTWYNKLNGLPLDNICGIIESNDHNIWVSGNSGIVKMDTKTKEFTNFTIYDGLLSNDFNMNATYRDSRGEIYFGGYGGVDYFDPDHIKTNTRENHLYLSELKIYNKKIGPTESNSPLKKVITQTDSISLTNQQAVFTIEYSGINYTRPEKNEYAYYLDGYENIWNYVGTNKSATYTNLDPGNYVFKLKSSNNDGVWSTNPLELKITVLPPWWKTNWALASYIGLFLLGLFILNKLTQNRIREKQLAKYEREKRQQEKELNEKKFQFFTNISHEFRTPLTLIMNPLQDIINNKDLNLSPKIKEKHRIIHKNTARLHRLVNELLDFRRLEFNKINVKATRINLEELTENVIAYFKEEALEKRIDLSYDSDQKDIIVWADENMIEKVIFNIVSNAFKATPEGGSINVALYASDNIIDFPLVEEGYQSKAIEIVVSDTGVGIEKEELNKMFERFYQVESLNKTYYGGTGIGLEVVQSFVNLHKGKIKVSSEIGKGTMFKVQLPVGKKHFGESEIQTTLNSDVISSKEKYLRSDTGAVQLKENNSNDVSVNVYTLLIVEDNIELRNYLKSELTSQYKVVTANHGKEGLKLAKEILPDVILTDVIMPKMDGLTFCKHIKTDIGTSHIPLLMLTAKAKIDDRIDGIEIGADAYMVKPFDMRLLKLRLSQLITSRQLIFNKYFSGISDLPANANTTSLDKEFIQKVLNYINSHIDDPDIGVESLAVHLNLSRSQVYRKIKALTNQTANEFIRNIRLHKAKVLIQAGNSNISEVSYAVGFSSSSYFTKCFKSYFGILPTQVTVEIDPEE
ncbi:ATP-binding protein [Galbibacter sp. EGI 63066]|uniref:hybrid sensor histidine kinase/response regulator transcription factor n=1 Tax=Galbibacter sp. EGI 63066 TaxID=2993559 RepID=UPI0022487F4E|nr:hybrid sensor histidine kinase/response regulator transcription factor [Galbibacter sp. EGI 63066]MCX2679278.1 ATP-binding protein [Galbibacter sp. EGI 63066]